jgi:hypothetical protein
VDISRNALEHNCGNRKKAQSSPEATTSTAQTAQQKTSDPSTTFPSIKILSLPKQKYKDKQINPRFRTQPKDG